MYKYSFALLLCAVVGILGIVCIPILKQPTKKMPPHITVVFIVDQFAYNYIPKLKPFLRYGIKSLLEKGVVYDDAHHPLGVPETSPGHHSISTGSLPKYHGVVYNSWTSMPGYKKIRYETDHTPHGDILRGTKEIQPGASPHNTTVDGLSDQFMQLSKNQDRYAAYSFSLKMHPVISCANRLGKALWLDSKTGLFTSSKAYFDTLPSWVVAFNKKHHDATTKPFYWKTAYPPHSAAYDFPHIRNYSHAAYPGSMITQDAKPLTLPGVSPYELFVRSPQSMDLLFDLAKKGVDHLQHEGKNRLLLFISLSNLDLCGHMYGPDSMECIDLVYHIDKQIADFMHFINEKVGAKNALYALTADHGVCPLPEITAQKGYHPAKRLLAKKIIAEMNELVQKKHGLTDFVKSYDPTFFIVDRTALHASGREKGQQIMLDLKQFLLAQPGIKKVWTRQEIAQLPFQVDDLEQFYKNQLYKDRNGDLTIMTEPYSLVTNYETGTSHSSPYEYDTHVPLIIHQEGAFKHKHITEKVWIPQLSHTIARILGITRPSASPFKPLPGIV
jgi:predicted AlkP superfamily pyrophosphatase or phosphodiesterase